MPLVRVSEWRKSFVERKLGRLGFGSEEVGLVVGVGAADIIEIIDAGTGTLGVIGIDEESPRDAMGLHLSNRQVILGIDVAL